MFDEYKNHDIAAYAGWILDNDELLSCTSGGIATALSREMIKMGGYVAGVTYTEGFYKAEYAIVNKINDLNKFKSSKYVEVDKGNVYKEVKKLLEEDRRVLFFGLPCVNAALRKVLGKDYDKLIVIDLICHGPVSSEIHREYIEFLEKKYNSKLVDFSTRKKLGRRLPFYLHAEFENGKIYEKKFYDTEYGYACRLSGKPQCYTCKFRGDNRTGDIMIGDFWGAQENDEFYNSRGISAILVHTHKGDKFLKSSDEIRLFETTFERIVSNNLSVIEPRHKHQDKKRFESLYKKHGLLYAAKHSKGFKTKLKLLRYNLFIKPIPNAWKYKIQKYYRIVKRKLRFSKLHKKS